MLSAPTIDARRTAIFSPDTHFAEPARSFLSIAVNAGALVQNQARALLNAYREIYSPVAQR
jgi:hypothetical protein